MASFAGRIQTDILVCGYVKHIMNIYQIQIPDEIIGLCFLFWLIKPCDEWDSSLCHKSISINGLYAEWTSDIRIHTLYAIKTVKSGVFKWALQLKTKSKIDWGYIGIIKSDQHYMKRNQCRSAHEWDRGSGWALADCNGILNSLFHYVGINSQLGQRSLCWDDGTIIEMILNLNEKTLEYRINDENYKTAPIDLSLSRDGYRLAVTLQNHGVELL